ncbi:MAG: hypothetical protein QXR69_00835 [Conexivisphaerales archaeon]
MIHRTKAMEWNSMKEDMMGKLALELKRKVHGFKRIVGIRMIVEKPTHELIVEGFIELVCQYDRSRSILDFYAILTHEGQLRRIKFGPS